MWIVILCALYILTTRSRNPVALEQRFAWNRMAGRHRGRRRNLASCCLVASVRHIANANMEREAEKLFPVEAARSSLRRLMRGRFTNDFNWGGYLIWALPHIPWQSTAAPICTATSGFYASAGCGPARRNTATIPIWPPPESSSPGRKCRCRVCLSVTIALNWFYQDEVAAVFVRKR